MKILKPKALRRGDLIAVVAPASPPDSQEAVARGVRYLEHLGYRVELGSNLYRRRGYLAGTDRERTADVHAAFSNPRVKAVFAVRGGYGCMRILPLLDFALMRKNPKILVGYSDITALQLAMLSKAGLVTFSGPMVGVEMASGLNGAAEERFWSSVTRTAAPQPIKILKDNIVTAGRGVGRIFGGNLSLVAALSGTPFFPLLSDPILLLEEVGERPYRIDRMLRTLLLAGGRRRTRAVVLGRFDDCLPEARRPSLSVRQVIGETFQSSSFPVVGGLSYGHSSDSLTMPIGIRARVDTAGQSLEFLEGGVC